MPRDQKYARTPSKTTAIDEMGPSAIYGRHADQPDLGPVAEDPFVCENLGLEAITIIHPPIQPALRVRPEYIGKYVFGMWRKECYAEYYLTPDTDSFWTHGKPECEWLHDAFLIFDKEVDAKCEGDRRRAVKGWYAFSVSRIDRIPEGIELVRICSNSLRQQPAGQL